MSPSPNPVKDDPVDGTLPRIKAVGALKAVQRRIEHALAPDRLLRLPDFFVLMIETRTWGFFHPTAGGFDPACRRDPPRSFAGETTDGDPVVLASETAMRQILAGKLPFERARAHGVVVIDADENREAVLRSAWSTAFPKTGLSSFVLSAAAPLRMDRKERGRNPAHGSAQSAP